MLLLRCCISNSGRALRALLLCLTTYKIALKLLWLSQTAVALLRCNLLLFLLLTILVFLLGNTDQWLVYLCTDMNWFFFISPSKVDRFWLNLRSLIQTPNKLESVQAVKMPIFKTPSRMLTINVAKQHQKSGNICMFCNFQSSIQGE